MAALFLAAGPFYAVPARADVVFDGSGICDVLGCSGIATGVLTRIMRGRLANVA